MRAAFQNNYKLQEVQLPDTVTTIENEAFMNCYKLKTINLDKVVEYGSQAFEFTALESFDFSKMESQTIPSGLLMFCYKLKEVKGASNITTISSGAFAHCTKLKTFDFPILTTIMANAFWNCTSIKEFNFKIVLEIYPSAFAQCTSLKSVEITHPITFITYQSMEYMSSVFSLCESLKSADLSGLNFIPNGLFPGCSKLNDVTFSSHLISIGEGAFLQCGFKELTIPDSVVMIGDGAFGSNDKLKKVTIGKGTPNFDDGWFAPATQSIKVVIPSSVKSIVKSAFNYMDNVKIEFSSENDYYEYQDQTLIGKVKKNLVSTVENLGKVYEVPEQIRVIGSDVIKQNIRDDDELSLSKSYQKLGLLVKSDGITRATIIKIQSNITQLSSTDHHVQSLCYEGDYYQQGLISAAKYDNYYATDSYLYDKLFNKEYLGSKCSTKLSDKFKWRHIVGMSGAEIGLTAALVVVFVLLVVVIILYFVFPFSKAEEAASA